MMPNPPFTAHSTFHDQRPAIVHDARLVRRYLLQSMLRNACTLTLPIMLLILLTAGLVFSLPTPPLYLWLLALMLMLTNSAIVRRHLQALREAGVALTPQMLSARPELSIVSPLDPLTTFDACAEALSGLSLGHALGYAGPARFSYLPFQGSITLSPPRTFLFWRRTRITVSAEPGQPVSIHIRGCFGLDFFYIQCGEAWRAVQTAAGHLQVVLQRRHDTMQRIKRQRSLEHAALHAKLAALQAQVEPHFLFNTLANLKYLVRTDAALAQQLLDHLVGYLQNAVPDMRRISSTLERELALASDYLAIMRIRMGDRLSFRIEASEAVRALPFPPAMLISLVENAIKHGLESATRPGELVISALIDGGALRVTVADNGVGLSDEPGQGVGLANIRERLQLLYGERASLSVQAPAHGGVEALLVLPVLAAAQTGAAA